MFNFQFFHLLVLCFKMMHGGLQLTDGGDFEALHCQLITYFDRSTRLDLTTEQQLLDRGCWRLPILSFGFLSYVVSLLLSNYKMLWNMDFRLSS
jgi:hypothetical protein